jgi:hypothetical protein
MSEYGFLSKNISGDKRCEVGLFTDVADAVETFIMFLNCNKGDIIGRLQSRGDAWHSQAANESLI